MSTASERRTSHFVAIRDPNFSYFVTIHSHWIDGSVVLSQYTHNWSISVTARRINFGHFVTIHSRRTDGPVILSQYTILTSAILSQYTRVGQTDRRHVSSFFAICDPNFSYFVTILSRICIDCLTFCVVCHRDYQNITVFHDSSAWVRWMYRMQMTFGDCGVCYYRFCGHHLI